MYFLSGKFFLRFFALFFLGLSPFLTVYSLGYNLDLEQVKLTHSIDITINTIPSGATVYNNEIEVVTTNVVGSKLTARDGELISLKVVKDGFLSEKFDIWGQPNQNTTARFSPLVLLPSTSEIKTSDDNKKLLTLIDKDNLLYLRNNQLFVQLYSFAGIRGNPEPVFLASPALISRIDENHWEDLFDGIYWQSSSDLILHRFQGNWYLFDLRKTNLNILDLVRLNETSVLALDNEKKVWIINLSPLLNPSADLITFLIGGINGISYTRSPDNIWFWSGERIFGVPRGSVRLLAQNLDIYEYLRFEDFGRIARNIENQDVLESKFVVKAVHQGLAFKIDHSLYYIPDFARNQPILITSDVFAFSTASTTLIWLDNQFGLYAHNLNLNNRQFLGDLNLEKFNKKQIKITYYPKWKRVLIYSPSQVFAVWFDKDIINRSVVGYYPVLWIDNTFCKSEIVENFQFCLRDNNLISYRNTDLW